MYTREWLISRTRFYQNLNFFEEYIDLSDEELADRMIWLRQAQTGGKISTLFHEGYDFFILCLDTNRVLSVATDWLYGSGTRPPQYNFECFLETIQSLSRISRGAFVPHDIKEVCSGRMEVILKDRYTEEGFPDHYYIQKLYSGTIEFVLNDEKYFLTPEGSPDDPLILIKQINPIILKTGYQFTGDASGCPDMLIFAMNTGEIEQWKIGLAPLASFENNDNNDIILF
jgi:hypothetical protein